MNINTLCPAVWDHLCVNTMGKNRLCCNAVTQEGDKFIGNLENHWTNFRNTVKTQMLAGDRPDVCKSCWKKEDANITSLRQQFIKSYKNFNYWEEFLNNLNNTKKSPTELDLKLGNYCNLSCRMCSSYSSSGVSREFKKIFKETGIDLGVDEFEKHFVQDKWYLQKEFVDNIKEIINNGLRHLKFTGGEPLMVPGVKTLINYCITNDYAKNIELVLITNATLIDNQWIEKFKHFKHVHINCSIDGIGNTFEYIRHPAKWTDVKKNLKKLALDSSDNFKTHITFTLQIYNILEIKNMIDLSKEFNLDIDMIPLDTPNYLDVRNAPQLLKDQALNIIDTLNFDGSYKQFVDNVRSTIIQSSNNSTEEFLKVTRLKDKYKKQNIETLEIWKYYE
jgi:sulfatase maturation enzyme AslB (radical SAM superfamily)